MVIHCCCNSPTDGLTAHNVEKYSSSNSSSPPTPDWQYQAGPNPTTTEGIRVDSSGNAWIMWYDSIAGTYKIDKVNSSGVKQATYTVDKITTSDGPLSVVGAWDVDDSGNIYTAAASATHDVVIKKYNSAGTLQWTSSALDCDNRSELDHIQVVCERSGTAGICALTPSDTGNETQDHDIHYIDTSGTIQWKAVSVTGFGSASQPVGAASVDANADVVVATNLTIGPFFFVRSYDSAGNINWTNSGAGTHDSIHINQPLPLDSNGDTAIVNNRNNNAEFTIFDAATGSENQNFANSTAPTVTRATMNSADNWLFVDNSPYTLTAIRNFTNTGTERWHLCAGWAYPWSGPSDGLWMAGQQRQEYVSFSDSSTNLSNTDLQAITNANSESGQLFGIYHHDSGESYDTALYVYESESERDSAFSGGAPYSTTGLLAKFEDADENFTGAAILEQVSASGVCGRIDIDTNAGGAAAAEKFTITGT